jgi:hypothetical protein
MNSIVLHSLKLFPWQFFVEPKRVWLDFQSCHLVSQAKRKNRTRTLENDVNRRSNEKVEWSIKIERIEKCQWRFNDSGIICSITPVDIHFTFHSFRLAQIVVFRIHGMTSLTICNRIYDWASRRSNFRRVRYSVTTRSSQNKLWLNRESSFVVVERSRNWGRKKCVRCLWCQFSWLPCLLCSIESFLTSDHVIFLHEKFLLRPQDSKYMNSLPFPQATTVISMNRIRFCWANLIPFMNDSWRPSDCSLNGISGRRTVLDHE